MGGRVLPAELTAAAAVRVPTEVLGLPVAWPYARNSTSRDYDGAQRDSPDDEELGRCWQDDCTWDRTADYGWTTCRCPSPVRTTY
ncbi:hypothetical protein [Nocardia wallacei]|uniref:hypothetical protein n=1 Tax=Nocardia wallacei TaxID=480035 RepID=UPI002454BC4A|nr:hypothetical protein [Nocardia wallacei]